MVEVANNTVPNVTQIPPIPGTTLLYAAILNAEPDKPVSRAPDVRITRAVQVQMIILVEHI